MNNNKEIICSLYAKESSELGENLEEQIRVIKKRAKALGITIVDTFQENSSAIIHGRANGMSNQFIIDLKKNVKRGMDSKYRKGVRPTRTPLGYINVKDTKTIDVDADRFDYIKGIWNLMLTGNYTLSEISDILDKFGFRTRKTAKAGGKKLTTSGIRRIFDNIFYTGYYHFNGELIRGTHEPLITLEEFDRVKVFLSKNK